VNASVEDFVPSMVQQSMDEDSRGVLNTILLGFAYPIMFPHPA
jgi:hypothetical protein